MTSRVPALIVHGGAGADPTEEPKSSAKASRAPSKPAGRSSAAVAAPRRGGGGGARLEDHPRFNAGAAPSSRPRAPSRWTRPSWRATRSERGRGLVSEVRNPITLARRILDDGRHSFFVGAGAIDQARALGVPLCDPRELVTARQRQRLEALQPGTVGAVAIDRFGTIVAGTSTGGRAGQLPGRVGDSPLIGCGTYAESKLGGVSCTGDGEATIRVVLARRTLEILRAIEIPSRPRRSRSAFSARKGGATADSS